VRDEGMDMDSEWNHGERRKPKYSEDTLTLCHFVHCSPHRWPRIDLGPPLPILQLWSVMLACRNVEVLESQQQMQS